MPFPACHGEGPASSILALPEFVYTHKIFLFRSKWLSQRYRRAKCYCTHIATFEHFFTSCLTSSLMSVFTDDMECQHACLRGMPQKRALAPSQITHQVWRGKGKERGREKRWSRGKRKGKKRREEERKKKCKVVFASLLIFILAKVAWQILRGCRAFSLKTKWMSRPGLRASL